MNVHGASRVENLACREIGINGYAQPHYPDKFFIRAAVTELPGIDRKGVLVVYQAVFRSVKTGICPFQLFLVFHQLPALGFQTAQIGPDSYRVLVAQDAGILEELFIVASVEAEEGAVGSEALVEVTKAAGEKCPRCWNVRKLGADARHPEVCSRCAGVLSGLEASL